MEENNIIFMCQKKKKKLKVYEVARCGGTCLYSQCSERIKEDNFESERNMARRGISYVLKTH